MKILYGVVGEGMGHATRSAVVLEHLVGAGHDVRVVVSGRAARYLEQRHPGRVTEIAGLTMQYEDNEVQRFRTALANLKAIKELPENLMHYLEMARDFTPDIVISDFESWAYVFARGQRIPVISIDNMQIIPRCFHEEDVLGDDMATFLLTKGFVKAKLPNCNAYLITTFFYPRVKKDRTTLHPPILRKNILDAKTDKPPAPHVLVYQSAAGHDELIEVLETQPDIPFLVYGMRRDITEPHAEGNVTYCPFSEDEFIRHLATSRAVICGGGFTLMSEAVYLGRPILSVPMKGQFEQFLNAAYLEKLGYGENVEDITPENLTHFLSNTAEYTENLAQFEHDRNQGLFDRLDEALEEAIREGPVR